MPDARKSMGDKGQKFFGRTSGRDEGTCGFDWFMVNGNMGKLGKFARADPSEIGPYGAS